MRFRRNDPIQALESRILLSTLPANFSENLMGGSIANATNLAFAPDGRLFVLQQTGQVRVVDHGVLQSTPFTTVSTYASVNGERGLLGIAFDPDYVNNHYVYVYYTFSTAPVHNRVSRFTADPNNQDIALAGSETVLLNLNNLSSATNHNGGSIHFGTDGKLYIAVGENANRANAQDFTNLLGKMLRMNKDGSTPTDNPYFNDASVTGQNKLIYSLGFRNPYTFAVQPTTGRIFIDDVGENTWEEINDLLPHKNYGWGAGSPTIEGFIAGQTPPADYMDPLFVYDHSNNQTAIIGGAFYNPVYNSFPASYAGQYFFADLSGGWIHTLDISGASPVVNNFATGTNTVSGVSIGPDGSIYYLQRAGTTGAFRIKYLDTTAPAAGAPSFIYDSAKPTFGTAQRVRLSFSEYVNDTLTPSDLTIVNQTTGQTIPTANISIQYDTSNNTADVSFPGFADANGVLPDGNYTLTIAASSVADNSGNPLSSGVNFSFFALAGDLNRDRHVDAADQAILSSHLGGAGTYAQGDLNYDGAVNAADQTILNNQLLLWLPPQGIVSLPVTSSGDQYYLKRESAAITDIAYNNGTTTTTRLYSGTIVGSLSIAASDGDDTLALDYSAGTLVPASANIDFDGGLNNDTLGIIGTTGADNVSFSASGNSFNSAGIIATNHEAVTFDGRGGFDTVSVFNGPTVTFQNTQHFASLNVSNGASAAAQAGGGAFIVTQSLSLPGSAKLDLNDNDLLLDYTSGPQIDAIQDLINSARAGGAWNGPGITSTTAKNNLPSKNTALGAMEATDYKSISALNTSFDGEPLDNTAVVIKYTYYGDANFNGKVDGTDYAHIDSTFNAEHSAGDIGGWLNGDFNGDGRVDGSDYSLIDSAFNSQGTPLRPISMPARPKSAAAASIH